MKAETQSINLVESLTRDLVSVLYIFTIVNKKIYELFPFVDWYILSIFNYIGSKSNRTQEIPLLTLVLTIYTSTVKED